MSRTGDANASRTGTSSCESRIPVWLRDHDLSLCFSPNNSKPFPFQSTECQLKMFIIVIQTMLEQIGDDLWHVLKTHHLSGWSYVL